MRRYYQLKRWTLPSTFIIGIHSMRCYLTFLILGCLLFPTHLLANADDLNNSEGLSPHTAIDQQQSEDIQMLRERVAFLEEQQSSILDDIAQRVVLGGYGSLEFEAFGGSRTTFEGKLELLISGQIHDRIRIYNEIDVGVPSETAKAEQAYIDFLIAQWVNLRGGVLLVPFGKFNLDHFDPRRDLTDRPLVATQIVPTTWGDLGVSLFGLLSLSPDLKATYEIAAINGFTNSFSTTSGGLRSARSGLGRDNNGDKAIVGRGTLKLVDQYEIGVSGYSGASNPSSGNRISGYDVDVELKPRGIATLEDFEFKAEFAHFTIQGSSTPSNLYGYYTQVNYHFWVEPLNQTFLGRHFNNPTFTAIMRYDHAKIDTSAGAGILTQDRYTIGVNYRPIEDYVIKTEYQVNDGGIGRKNWEGFLASIAWLF